MYAAGSSTRQLARVFGVGKSVVWNVVTGKGWKHVADSSLVPAYEPAEPAA